MEVKPALFISWLLWTFMNQCVSAFTTIIATAPLSEVEEGAILSVHCKVVELQERHEVTLFRTRSGKTERVSVNGVLTLEEDRIFLAERQLNDGSVVYFLSVTDVSQSDQGSYKCQVYDPVEQTIVVEDMVYIGILYFPRDYPVCSYKESLQVMEGDRLQFNCTSEKANPTVSLEWSRTVDPNSNALSAKQIVHDQHVVSILTLRPRLSDSDAVYICKATSSLFPNEGLTCHIGPVHVVRNPKGNTPPKLTPEVTTISGTVTLTDKTNRQSKECAQVCSASTFNSPVFKWIISTTIAGLVAVTFFIIVIIFLWKYYHVQTTTRNLYVTARPQLAEQLYSELECKRTENMTYMSLTKEDSKRLNQEFITKYCPAEQRDDKS